MAKKTVCDFCGKDASEEEYIVPLKKTYYAENSVGVKLMTFDRMESTTVNLCDSCFITIGNTLSKMRDHFEKINNKKV